MGHLFRRTLVMPDHLTSSMDHLHAFGRQQLADFFDFRDLSTWVPVITMQEYLDVRCAVLECRALRVQVFRAPRPVMMPYMLVRPASSAPRS